MVRRLASSSTDKPDEFGISDDPTVKEFKTKLMEFYKLGSCFRLRDGSRHLKGSDLMQDLAGKTLVMSPDKTPASQALARIEKGIAKSSRAHKELAEKNHDEQMEQLAALHAKLDKHGAKGVAFLGALEGRPSRAP